MQKKNNNSEIAELLGMISQVGITMLVPIILMTLLFAWLGRVFDISWLAVIGFVWGAASGFLGSYRILKKYLHNKDDKYSL